MYFWDFGDNSSSTLQNPDYSYFFPGTYDITLTIITTTGCIDTSVVTLTDAVMVIPMPVPGLVIPVKKVSVFEPVVQVNDTSRLRIGCRIYISDGSWYDTCTVTHNFRDTGVYYISQVVVNEFGCRDSVTLEVYVYPEFRLFIPNAFTPNRDELNDIFLPVILGSEQYLLEIYNRWGERIFVTDRQNLGWDGKQNGEDCAQDAYVYRITVRPPYQEQRILTGSVTLIR
jgi:gliding motility-associated-like protein